MARKGSTDWRRWRRFFVGGLAACAVTALGVAIAAASSGVLEQSSHSWAHATTRRLAQSQAPSQDHQILSPAQVKKYIAVYVAMQHDHALTVEKAAAHEGMTVAQFRDIENRILRNPQAHARVMRALKAAAEARAKKTAPKLSH